MDEIVPQHIAAAVRRRVDRNISGMDLLGNVAVKPNGFDRTGNIGVNNYGGKIRNVPIRLVLETKGIADGEPERGGVQLHDISGDGFDVPQPVVHVQRVVALTADIAAFHTETTVGIGDMDRVRGGRNVCAGFIIRVNADKGIEQLKMGRADAENKEAACTAVDLHIAEGDMGAVFRADALAVVDVVAQDIRFAVVKTVHTTVVRHAQHVGRNLYDAFDWVIQPI